MVVVQFERHFLQFVSEVLFAQDEVIPAAEVRVVQVRLSLPHLALPQRVQCLRPVLQVALLLKEALNSK